MVWILKNGATKKEIDAIEKKIARRRSVSGFDAKKFNGILKKRIKKDPLEIQTNLRNEWERTAG
jgi:hypothetical protein